MNGSESPAVDFPAPVSKRRTVLGAKPRMAAAAVAAVTVVMELAFFLSSRDGNPTAHYVSEEAVIGRLTVTYQPAARYSRSNPSISEASYQRALANEVSASAATNQALAVLKSDESNISKVPRSLAWCSAAG